MYKLIKKYFSSSNKILCLNCYKFMSKHSIDSLFISILFFVFFLLCKSSYALANCNIHINIVSNQRTNFGSNIFKLMNLKRKKQKC